MLIYKSYTITNKNTIKGLHYNGYTDSNHLAYDYR